MFECVLGGTLWALEVNIVDTQSQALQRGDCSKVGPKAGNAVVAKAIPGQGLQRRESRRAGTRRDSAAAANLVSTQIKWLQQVVPQGGDRVLHCLHRRCMPSGGCRDCSLEIVEMWGHIGTSSAKRSQYVRNWELSSNTMCQVPPTRNHWEDGWMDERMDVRPKLVHLQGQGCMHDCEISHATLLQRRKHTRDYLLE
jgi:hypothetical protein